MHLCCVPVRRGEGASGWLLYEHVQVVGETRRNEDSCVAGGNTFFLLSFPCVIFGP